MGKCWYYGKGKQAPLKAVRMAPGTADGAAARLPEPARSVNTDPDGPVMQWQLEHWIRTDVRPGTTPHFTSMRLLAAPMPGGWEGQHFYANGWLSEEGPALTTVFAAEGTFNREAQFLRYAMCWCFPKVGAPTVRTLH